MTSTINEVLIRAAGLRLRPLSAPELVGHFLAVYAHELHSRVHCTGCIEATVSTVQMRWWVMQKVMCNIALQAACFAISLWRVLVQHIATRWSCFFVDATWQDLKQNHRMKLQREVPFWYQRLDGWPGKILSLKVSAWANRSHSNNANILLKLEMLWPTRCNISR